jgi:hypothetical protein
VVDMGDNREISYFFLPCPNVFHETLPNVALRVTTIITVRGLCSNGCGLQMDATGIAGRHFFCG